MLLVIHNLPGHTKYADVKALIQSKCGLTELILDNLSSEGPLKRVTVGLADEGDGAILVRKINGLYIEGKQLYVEDIRKKKDSEQPYRSNQKLPLPQASYGDFSLTENPRENTQMNNQDVAPAYQNPEAMNMMYNMAAMSSMYYMPNMQAMSLDQNTYLGFGGQPQQLMPMMPQVTETPEVLDRQQTGFDDPDVDWGSNNSRQPDRSHAPFEERRRVQSPQQKRPDVFLDRGQSRWDNVSEARESLHRSRSPQRGLYSRDRPNNRQNRFENYYEDSEIALNNEPQNYNESPRNVDYSASNSRARNMDPSTSNFGARNVDPISNFGTSRNKNLSTANFGGRNMDPSPSNFGTSRNKNLSTANFGGRNMDPSHSNFKSSRNKNLSTANFGGRNTDPSPSNFGTSRNKNHPTANFGGRNMESSPSNLGTSRNKNLSTANFGGRNMDPSTFNIVASRNKGLSASNFRDSEPFIEEPSSDVFPSNHMQTSAFRRDETAYVQNQFEPEPYQPQRDGRNFAKNRGGNNPPVWDTSMPNESRGSNRGGFDSSRQFENQRNESRGAMKRGSSKWDGEPQAKRYAAQMGPGSQRPPFGPVAQNAPNPRERPPKPRMLENDGKEMTLERLMNKDETWRGQATSCIAKELVKSLQLELSKNSGLFTHLKHCIRARINVMLQDKIFDRLKIMEMYASKFPPESDQEFFLFAKKDFEKQQEAKEGLQALAEDTVSGAVNAKQIRSAKWPTGKPPVLVPKPAAKLPVKPAAKPPVRLAAKPPVKLAANKPIKSAAKPTAKPKETPQPSGNLLPSFPEGDKSSYKNTKAKEKKKWFGDKYEPPEDLKKALDEEVDTLCDIFMGECMDPPNNHEKVVCEQIADVVSDEFRKAIRNQLAKRLLNDTKNLIVRVLCVYKMPPRADLEKFLLPFGCVALQKSERTLLMLAHLNSYDKADELLALGSAEIAGVTVSFKTFQIAGPEQSAAAIRNRLKNFKQAQIDRPMDDSENILQPGYVYQGHGDKDGNTSIVNDKGDEKNANSLANEEEKTNWDVETEEKVETEVKPEEKIETEANVETQVTVASEDDEADENGDYDKNHEPLEFADEADEFVDDNIDEDDLEDY